MVCFVVMGLHLVLTTRGLRPLLERGRWYIARSDYPRCPKSYEECEAFARQWHKERPLRRYSLIFNRYRCERKVMFYNAWYGNDIQRKRLNGIILIPAR